MQHHADKVEREFLDVYSKQSDALFRFCYFRVFDRERAKDLVQETFMRTWKQIAEGADIENIRAFLYRVARNLVIDESRKKKALSLDALQEGGFDPAAPTPQPTDPIDAQRLLAALDAVDEQFREVLVMRFVDDLQPREIASILEESANVISVRVHRGIKQLRERFRP